MVDIVQQSPRDGNRESTDATVAVGRRDRMGSMSTEFKPGDTVGRYRIEAVVASGGMGTVFRAEQIEPVRRQVALKMVRADVAGPAVLKQFLEERQVLARLDHPDIARIYDADATPSGEPFFVMEFADGQPIDRYCDARRLSVRDRVELLIRVARAVESAHHRGVLHCDLKPSNILVTEADGRPQVKIIDFGIARTTNVDRDESAPTSGTPDYMSPEQAGGYALDTRSDLYSLGAVFYRLLTGSVPLEPLKANIRSWPQLRETLTTFTPQLPSERVSSVRSDERESLAAERSLPASQLSRALRGDVDWIARRALANLRSDRYANVGDFADELQRFLDDLPLMTAVPGRGYRLRKFCKRHRGAVVGGCIALAILLISATALSLGWWQEHLREQQELATARSESEALLREAESAWNRARRGGAHAEAELSRAEASLDGVRLLLRDHASHAEVRQKYRQLQSSLQFDRRAFNLIRKLQRARELASGTGLNGKRSDTSLKAGLQSINTALRDFGISPKKATPTEVSQRLEECPRDPLRKIIESLDFVINESTDRAVTEWARDVLAAIDPNPWRTRLRSALWESNIKSLKELSQNEMLRDQRPFNLIQLAGGLYRTSRSPDALRILRLARSRHPENFWVNHYLGMALIRIGGSESGEESLRYLTSAVSIRPRSGVAHCNLAMRLCQLRRFDEAVAECRQAAKLEPARLQTQEMVAAVLEHAGRYREALREFERILKQHPGHAAWHERVAWVAFRLGDWQKVIEHGNAALKIAPTRWSALEAKAGALVQLGRKNKAVAAVQTAMRQHPDQPQLYRALGSVLLSSGRYRSAVKTLANAVELAPEDAATRYYYGLALQYTGSNADAIRQYHAALRLRPHYPDARRRLDEMLKSSP